MVLKYPTMQLPERDEVMVFRHRVDEACRYAQNEMKSQTTKGATDSTKGPKVGIGQQDKMTIWVATKVRRDILV